MTSHNGLPQDHIFCLLQDRQGFLWLGMETGLARYDGYTFKVYQHDPDNPHSISSNIVKAIHQDRQGQLWIGTDGGGICRFDPGSERFHAFQHDPDDPQSLSGNRVYSIAGDAAGNIWAATLGNGLNRLHFPADTPQHPRITRFRHDPTDPYSIGSDNIWTLRLGSGNRLWIGTGTAGLDRLDLPSHPDSLPRFRHYRHRPDQANSLSNNSVKAIFEDTAGKLWVGTEFNGLNRLDPATDLFTHYLHDKQRPDGLSHDHVSDILEDDQGRLWIATNGGGLNLLDRKSGRFRHFRHSAGDPFSINGNLLNTLYQDRSGVIWIGFVIKGLSWIDPQKQKTRHHYPIEGQAGSLRGHLVKVIYEDRSGSIWIGTYGGGLSRFDPGTGTFRHHPGSNNVQAILEDKAGRLWIGTDGNGLLAFDRRSHTFTAYNQSPSGKTRLSGHSVWALCEDIRGNLWVGTADGGLNCLDARTGEFRHFPSNPLDPHSLQSNDIRVLHEDRLGFLWIGTYGGGLNRYNPAADTFVPYKKVPGDTTAISSDIITAIFESPRSGTLWIGTFGGGLNRFDRLSESFHAIREHDGLPNDVVKSIEEDDRGSLWVSTLEGISQYSPESHTFANFGTDDGMQAAFNLGSSALASDGQLYFGGTNGFHVFDPAHLTQRADADAPCLLTDLKIFNRSVQPGEIIRDQLVLPTSVSETEEIVIPYSIDAFAFEFASLDFARSDKIRYAYRLEGVDGQWQYTDASRRYAPYANLYQGTYRFQVRATHEDGTWSGPAAQVRVRVLTAPWKTPGAYAVYLLLLIALGYGLRVYTLARWRLLNELKLERMERTQARELNEMKLRFFTNISHEIRTPLTLILGPLEQLIAANIADLSIRNQLQTMRTNANRLALLINQLLDFRKQETGHTRLKVVKADLVKFTREICLSFQEFAQRKQVRFQCEDAEPTLPLWFDPQQMEIILYNLLSNAIKFVPEGGRVRVRTATGPDGAELTVENDGDPIPAEDLPFIFDRFYKFDREYAGNYLGSGIGLALTKGLVELHGGTISVESPPGGPTVFRIVFRMGKAHFTEEQFATDFRSGEDVQHYRLPAGPETAGRPEPAGPEAPLLLLVEDNPDVRQYLTEIFRPAYRLLSAGEGAEGLRLALQHQPDVVVSDIMMPEMDGLELCRRLKTDITTSHIPVILLTARTSLVFRAEGLETGADDYVTKPFSPGILMLRVKNLIESRRRLRERFGSQLRLEPKEVTLTTPDEELLRKAIAIVERHMDDSTFDVNRFAHEIGMSRPVLYRKIPALTNYTPNEFIRMIRLKRAAQLLRQNVLSVADICYSTGFQTPKYFSKCFKEAYQVSPSEYARTKGKESGVAPGQPAGS